MKKIKVLSVLLAVLIALTCVSAFSTSAALIKTISSVEIVEVPDDIYTKSADEMLYGIKVKVGFSNKISETVTLSADNVEEPSIDDYTDSLACSYASADISVGIFSSVSVSLLNYVGDYVMVEASAYGDDYYSSQTTLSYPDDYVLPEIFCKDYLVYRDNDDGTLSLINHAFTPSYYFYIEDYEEPPVVITEEIYGKTVVSVENYALLGTTHPYSVTIPGTVTSIGEYAFGYCFRPNYYGDNHNVPDNVAVSRLSYKLAEADDDDTFLVSISFFTNDPQALSDTIQAEYLSDCEDYEYDADYEYAYATLTKAQIYSMQDVNDIMINLLYEKDSYIAEEIYDFAEYAGYDAEMCVEFFVYASDKDELTTLCKELSNNYFGGRTDYIVDDTYYMMRVNATFEQIRAASMDDVVDHIYFHGADGIFYDLYKELYFEDDSYTTDVFAIEYGEETVTENYLAYADTYFADCDIEIYNFEGQETLIIKGATKQQILEAGQDDSFGIDLFGYPLISSYNDIVIYGQRGSAAQEYAQNNAIEFVATDSEFELGDVNLDGKITVTDATDILKYNVDLIEFTDEQKALADFDRNGVINVMDASELQRAIVNS